MRGLPKSGLPRTNASSAPKIIFTSVPRTTASALWLAVALQRSTRTRVGADAAQATRGAEKEPPSTAGLASPSDWLLRRLGIFSNRRTRAHQIAVAIDIVDPSDRRPVFIGARTPRREA